MLCGALAAWRDCPNGDRTGRLAPFGDLEGLDLAGVKWPLANRDVALGATLTLSNIALGPVEIGLRSGHGVAIAYPPPGADD